VQQGDVATGPGWELRCGKWQDVLADVEADALITDAPYSDRTHGGQRHGRRPEMCNGEYVSARGLDYGHLTPADVSEIVESWSTRTHGWIVSLTDSELYPAWRDALRAHKRTVFAPLPCVQVGMNVRLAGDGPSSWTCWGVVGRTVAQHKWGTLPGAYWGNPFDAGQNSATASRRSGVVGSKPLWLMRALIRDYTRPGDLVCDPFAGGGTTLLAAVMEGRRAIGAEMMPAHFDIARKRLERGFTPPLQFGETRPAAEQTALFTTDKE
jgi:site-specific DNA-methyltransferase (adenine-specific)